MNGNASLFDAVLAVLGGVFDVILCRRVSMFPRGTKGAPSFLDSLGVLVRLFSQSGSDLVCFLLGTVNSHCSLCVWFNWILFFFNRPIS